MSTVNKRQEEVRRKLHTALDEVLDTLVEDLRALDPYQRVRLALMLSEYVLPRIKPDGNDAAYHAEMMSGGWMG